jgi:uncharacterized protein with HEPN domain
MRREYSYLTDIVDAADAIAGFIQGRERTALYADDLLQSAVLHKLTLLGEAAARLSRALRDRRPEVPWQRIISIRNRTVHEYFGIDWGIIWSAVTEDVPQLRRQIAVILSQEFPEETARRGE